MAQASTKKLLKVQLCFHYLECVSVLLFFEEGKDTSWGQAGTTWWMHQSSWICRFGASNFCQTEISIHHHWQHYLGVNTEWQADNGWQWQHLAQAAVHSYPTGFPPALLGLNLPCWGFRWRLRTSIIFKLTILLLSDILKTTGLSRNLRSETCNLIFTILYSRLMQFRLQPKPKE